MGLFTKQTNELDAATLALKQEIANLQAERNAQQNVRRLDTQISQLKGQVADLQIQKSKLDEDNQRERRELTHMIGLEQKRQEQESRQAKVELEQAKAQARLDLREENLKAEKVAFDKQMEFQKEQFDGQVDYLKELMGQILERLPNISETRSTKTVNTNKTTAPGGG